MPCSNDDHVTSCPCQYMNFPWFFKKLFILLGLVTTCTVLVTGKNLYSGSWKVMAISLSYFLLASLKDLPFLT
jgi:hypothetical protein